MTYTPPNLKLWGVIKVGGRFYWLVYRPFAIWDCHDTNGVLESNAESVAKWQIGEGFCATREEAASQGYAAYIAAAGEDYLSRRNTSGKEFPMDRWQAECLRE